MENAAQVEAARKMEELAASLRHLLERQLAAGRAGDFAGMLQLGELASAIAARIVEQGGSAPALAEDQRRELRRLYDELTVMLGAEQADTQGKLRQLRRVKRAVNAYRIDR